MKLKGQAGGGRLCALVCLLGGVTAALAAPPEVWRVDPPNWWVGHSHNPVRLLVTGRHLDEARLVVPDKFTAADVRISENGHYLLFDLTVPGEARPGEVPLRVETTAGEAPVPFALQSPLPRAGRFQGFGPEDVIYLVMIDRFANGDPDNDHSPVSPGLLDRSKLRHYHGGDLLGLQQRLDYLKELGVTALWTTPWYDNVNQLNHREKYTAQNQLSADGIASTDYHGYGAVDFYAVEDRFGSLDTLRRLVDSAQRAGIKVIQDQVANHTGPYHPWVTNPPTPTWFHGTPEEHLDNGWHTWTTAASNPPPDKLRSTLEGWFINILPDLNQTDPEVATYLIQNSLWWVGQTGLDAIRQDTLPYVPRRYWAQWTEAVKREYPQLTILGEFFEGNPELVSFFQGGRTRFDGVDTGVDTLFDFPLFYAMRDVFAKGQPMTRLTDTLRADTNYVDASVLVTFLGLHDTPRFLHEPGATPEGLKLAFTYLLTTRGTPMIYYGDEIGMNGAKDPFNRADFPGGWPEDEHSAFDPDRRTPAQAAMHGHVQRLLQLRSQIESLRRGRLVNLVVDADALAYARVTPRCQAVVAFNNSTQAKRLTVPLGNLGWASGQRVVDRLGTLGVVTAGDAGLDLLLPARSAALFTPVEAVAEARGAGGGATSGSGQELSVE